MKTIDEITKQLPPELQREVQGVASSLLEKRTRRRGTRLRQDWAGRLRDFRGRYTSPELQKKAMEWRGD